MGIVILLQKDSRRVENIFNNPNLSEDEIIEKQSEKNSKGHLFLKNSQYDFDITDLKFGDIINENGDVDKDKKTKKKYIYKEKEKLGDKIINENKRIITVDSDLSKNEKQEGKEKFGSLIKETEIDVPSDSKKQFLKERSER